MTHASQATMRHLHVPRLLRRCRSLPKHLLRSFDTLVMYCDNPVRPTPPDSERTLLAIHGDDPAGAAMARRAMREAGEPFDEVEERLRNGDHVCVLCDGSGPIAFNWICFHRRREIGLWIDAAPGRAILYNGFVLPQHRGRGIGQEMILRICSVLGQRGCTVLASAVNVTNQASIGMLAASGFRPVLETHRLLIADRYFTPMRITTLDEAGVGLIDHGTVHAR